MRIIQCQLPEELSEKTSSGVLGGVITIWNTPREILGNSTKRSAFEQAVQKGIAGASGLRANNLRVSLVGPTLCDCRAPIDASEEFVCPCGQITVMIHESIQIKDRQINAVVMNAIIAVCEEPSYVVPMYDELTRLFTDALSTLMCLWWMGRASPSR